jgi:hypothetical protein
MIEWIAFHVFLAVFAVALGCLIFYCVPHERATSHRSTTPNTPQRSGDAVSKGGAGFTMLGLTLCGLSGIFSIFMLMFLYGIVVLVFRNAYGVELPLGRFN